MHRALWFLQWTSQSWSCPFMSLDFSYCCLALTYHTESIWSRFSFAPSSFGDLLVSIDSLWVIIILPHLVATSNAWCTQHNGNSRSSGHSLLICTASSVLNVSLDIPCDLEATSLCSLLCIGPMTLAFIFSAFLTCDSTVPAVTSLECIKLSDTLP